MMYGEPFSYKTLPPAVKSLVTVHASVYLAQWIAWDPVVRLLALSPSRVTESLWVWQPLTAIFLHTIGLFGFIFFLIHMYILSNLGRDLERRWGSAGFALYYLGCGLAAGAVTLLLGSFAPAVSLLSSAALLGMVTAFATLFPGAQVMFFFIPMTARQLILMIAGLEVLLAVSRMVPWVEAAAQLSAMGTGFLLVHHRVMEMDWGRLWRRYQEEKRAKRYKIQAVNLDREVDRILDKVLKDGQASLTRQEQDLMRQYSKSKK